MFSGIIEELGQVKRISKKGSLTLVVIKADKTSRETTKPGDSIAVNGVCLTVVKTENLELSFEVMPQTLKISNIKELKIGDKVNLERSLKIGDRLSGHFVTGHIECLGIIRKKGFFNGNLTFEIAVPANFLAYALPKGSIAVDGISLTISSLRSNTFSVHVIPHTLDNTTLGFKGPSDKVNIEFDILVKKPSTVLRF